MEELLKSFMEKSNKLDTEVVCLTAKVDEKEQKRMLIG